MTGRAALLRAAETEAAEVRSWTCATCDTMVETEGDHCRACASYWSDVDDGMYDDEWEIIG